MSSETKVWFVTGSSSGFGLCITKCALQKGDQVISTLRKPEILSDLAAQYPDSLVVLKVDVTKPADVTAAFAAGVEKFGRIDVVVNNAGFGIVSEVEGTKDRTARDLFEVNFWGASYVSKEAVRVFREENRPMGGRLLQISSRSGVLAQSGISYYSASKFALEGFSEGLAGELDPNWNIKITILEPGPFFTNAPTVNCVTEPAHPAYTDPSLQSTRMRKISANPTAVYNGDPEKFAAAVYRVAYLEGPPLRLPIHAASLATLRKKGEHLLETANQWESWSEDLLINC